MPRTLEILDRLVAFPTVSRNSNLDLIDWVRDLLQTAGFQVHRIYSPERSKAGLFARIGPQTEGGVCLSAHTDVVPVDGQPWTRPAFELSREGERLYGRGTTDMKGFLASLLALAERAAKAELKRPLSLSISYDEEIGCVGIRQMMPQLAKFIGKPDAVIVGEPTSMQIAIGHKGKTASRLNCHGDSGHSALAPKFVNAIHVAADVVREIQQVQMQLAKGPRDEAYSIPYSTAHVGCIEGGRALNIVPDLATLDLEIRHLPQVHAHEIRAMIDAALTRVSDHYPSVRKVEIEETNAYPGLALATDDPIIAWAGEVTHGSQVKKVAFGTEAGFFAELGLSTIVIGPGDMATDGHKPDEGLDISQLNACDAMMNRICADLSG